MMINVAEWLSLNIRQLIYDPFKDWVQSFKPEKSHMTFLNIILLTVISNSKCNLYFYKFSELSQPEI